MSDSMFSSRPVQRALSGLPARLLCALALPLALLGAPAAAAPLDALLSVDPAHGADRGFVEGGFDFVNGAVDILRLRDEADAQRGLGDYSGGHLRLGGWVTPRVWLDGALWRRSISYGPDKPRIDSHQLAAQYLLTHPASVADGRPSFALRLGYWGDRSSLLRKSTPSSLITSEGTFTVDEVSVDNARDRQLQVDLIGSWTLSPALTMNAFVGVGRSKVSIGGVSVRRGSLTGTNAGGCSDTVRLAGFELQDLIQVDGEACYRATFLQLGANLRWKASERWTMVGGYSLQRLSRDRVDDIVESRGNDSYTLAHTLIGQVNYRLTPGVQVFGRGQLMSSPFLGEIPFLYNSITASRFGKAYGIATVGLVVEF